MTVTTPTRVGHVKYDAYDVYVGRDYILGRGKERKVFKNVGWGNPYKNVNAVSMYRMFLMTRPDLFDRIPELQGKTLACWCRRIGAQIPPNALHYRCHGEVLAELADSTPLIRQMEFIIADLTLRDAPREFWDIARNCKRHFSGIAQQQITDALTSLLNRSVVIANRNAQYDHIATKYRK